MKTAIVSIFYAFLCTQNANRGTRCERFDTRTSLSAFKTNAAKRTTLSWSDVLFRHGIGNESCELIK